MFLSDPYVRLAEIYVVELSARFWPVSDRGSR